MPEEMGLQYWHLMGWLDCVLTTPTYFRATGPPTTYSTIEAHATTANTVLLCTAVPTSPAAIVIHANIPRSMDLRGAWWRLLERDVHVHFLFAWLLVVSHQSDPRLIGQCPAAV